VFNGIVVKRFAQGIDIFRWVENGIPLLSHQGEEERASGQKYTSILHIGVGLRCANPTYSGSASISCSVPYNPSQGVYKPSTFAPNMSSTRPTVSSTIAASESVLL
jgi:hypothetical protein